MWMRGYVTPVHETLIKHFESSGYVCHTVTRQPSKFWKRLWDIMAALLKMRRVLVAVGTIVVVASFLLRLYSVA